MSAPSGPAPVDRASGMQDGPPLLDGRYRLGPVIARGGMSTVHHGTDTRLDRAVAIKVMDPTMAADPAFRSRFGREARLAARIGHPAVVGVYDQGAVRAGELGPGTEATLFLVMELVPGGTLRDVLRARGPVGLPAAVRVLDPVLDGLAAAHRLGMVHRDVKPENVLIAPSGEVKVADFGLLTAAAEAGVSHAGMILGTMAYLSPEQVTTGRADARSDVYAAGIVLYELLTGVPPYQADNPLSVAYRHVNDDVPPPSDRVPGLPPEIDAMVARATDRDPERRPADANGFRAELAAVASRLGLPAGSVPRPPVAPDRDTVPASPRRVHPSDGAAAGPSGTRAVTALGGPPVVPTGEPEGLTRSELRGARQRGRRVFALWLVVLLLVGLLAGAGAWWVGSGRWTTVPQLAGVDRARATALLTEADLTPSVTERADDAAAPDTVVAGDPQTGTRILRGSTVTLTISTGPPRVPDVLAGSPVAVAEDMVKRSGLTPVRSNAADVYSDAVPQGAVVRTDPPSGTAAKAGDAVTLVLSRGPEPAPAPAPAPEPEPASASASVPFVVGKKADDAVDELKAAGFDVEVDRSFPFLRGREGTVVSQDPRPGEDAEPGDTVTVKVL
ncbi:Stk1 family PASTA domain-containing Ser/Thr kinase [Pseudonocardia endophytica]|uniref:non-specific serine/threonine protein kinase n=1 Tax=Pseudonocardia endophytica TaxID=401976 RepID=A0A4R1HWD1_PSEEN|nr:Stk1 family PASTA domain-containing Ser/Thr kinase [Pseudonocardia endophytica]TCK25060.1 serine/threonine-protein kinase [Pseudonocardia endophytica]